jgi:hypothetical protein
MKILYALFFLLLISASLHAQNSLVFEKQVQLNHNPWLSPQVSLDKIHRYPGMVSNSDEALFRDTINAPMMDTTKYNMYGGLLNDDPVYNKRAPLWQPIMKITLENALINLVDHYIIRFDWAVVGFSSWNRTFIHSGFPWNNGWKWDIDRFGNNFLLHPYTGAGYFNSARASGYNFWESSALTFFGAYEYKLFGENGWPNGKPERNDLIATTLGGMVLGEGLYRLGSDVIDERATGVERVGREIVAFFISPGRSFSRLFDGKMFAHTTEDVYQTQPLNITMAAGYHRVNAGTKIENPLSNSLNLDMIIDYGNPFEKVSRKPFDYYRVRADLDFGVGRKYVDNLTGYGILYGSNVQYGNLEMLAGVFQHMNYFDNNTFELGTFAFGPGIISKLPMSNNSSLYTNLHATIVPFGGLSTRLGPIDTTQVRDYNFVGGAELKLESNYNIAGWVNMTFIGYYWWLHTYAGIPGNAYVGLIRPRIAFKVFNNISIGFEHMVYYSDRYPHDFVSVHTVRTEEKIFVQMFFEGFKLKK